MLCFCPDMSLGKYDAGGMVKLVERPVAMKNVWSQADAVVSYGATTFVCQALLAGKPQLIIPADVEKWMVARRMASLGTGVVIRTEMDISDALNILYGPSILFSAQRIADHYATVDWKSKLDLVMQEELFH